MKILLIIVLVAGTSLGSYFGYQHYYVETLKISEIVGTSDDDLTNIAVKLMDFDTGLTRHDIKQLNDKKDYWITRINELEKIQNDDQKQQATIQLLADFLDEPVVKKLKSKLIALSPDSTLELIKTIIQN